MQRTHLYREVIAVLPESGDPDAISAVVGRLGQPMEPAVLGHEAFSRAGWVFLAPNDQARRSIEAGDDFVGISVVANVFQDEQGRMLVGTCRSRRSSSAAVVGNDHLGDRRPRSTGAVEGRFDGSGHQAPENGGSWRSAAQLRHPSMLAAGIRVERIHWSAEGSCR